MNNIIKEAQRIQGMVAANSEVGNYSNVPQLQKDVAKLTADLSALLLKNKAKEIQT